MNDKSDSGVPMSWVYIDDQSTFHSRVVKGGNAAWGACIRMIAWSNSQLSDGMIPDHIAHIIATGDELKSMVACGMLETRIDGYYIHDYLDWNKSAKEIKNLKQKTSESRSKTGKAGGIASGKSRNSKHLEPEAKSKQNEAPTLPNPTQPKEEDTLHQPRAHALLIDYFQGLFVEARGVKPEWPGKEVQACRRMLESHGLEQCKNMVHQAFQESWFVNNQATLSWIANNPNKYLGKPKVINAKAPRSFDPFPEGNE